jgi:O-antigen/teichoic acid export membrane protein
LASLLLLARNLIVARLIPVADFGVAATFAVAMSVVEMMSTLGLQQQIVQSRDGDDPHFQAALQGFQVLRGAISSLVLFAIAIPLARFFGIPEAGWAYQAMAVVPMLNALGHFDIYRLNRTMVFGPMILTGIVPALVSVLAVWPLSLWFGDWRVMLYAILIQALLTTLTSHIAARRAYRIVLDRALMRQSIRFGWPLLANGILMFLVFNGDRMIVGRKLGMETLAIFSMGITLTLTPTLVLAKSIQNFFLPPLSKLDHAATPEAGQRFERLAIATIEANLLNGALLVFGTALLGGPFVHLLLGAKYAALVPVLTLLAVMQALRVFKAGGAVIALARRQTSNAMVANLCRVASLPVAWWAVATGGSLTEVIWIGIAGEFCGFIVSLLMLRGRVGVRMKPLWRQLTLATLFLILCVGSTGSWPFPMPYWAGTVAQGLVFGALVLSMSTLRKAIQKRLQEQAP